MSHGKNAAVQKKITENQVYNMYRAFLVVPTTHKNCTYALLQGDITLQGNNHMLRNREQATPRLCACFWCWIFSFRAIQKIFTQKIVIIRFAGLKNNEMKLLLHFCCAMET